MAEQCRLCGTSVRVATAAHVMLNAPEAGVRDYYVCSTCYEDSVDPLFSRAVGEGGDDPPEDAGPSEDPESDVDGGPDGDVAAPE